MQGVENSEFGYVPARQTTLLHSGARKADGGSMARTLTQIRCVQTPQHVEHTPVDFVIVAVLTRMWVSQSPLHTKTHVEKANTSTRHTPRE